jgi:hypothetical protein
MSNADPTLPAMNANANSSGAEIDRLEKSLADLVAESRRLEAQVEAIKSQQFLKPEENKILLAGAEVIPATNPSSAR